MFKQALLISACLSLSTAAQAQDVGEVALPDLARAMLQSAYDTGDASQVSAVANATKSVFPDYAEAIDIIAARQVAELTPIEADVTTEAEAAPPKGGLFAISPWEGKFQAGASFASGNSDNTAVGVLLDAARETGKFKHNINAYFDIADSSGVQTQKRWGAAYQLDYNVSDRLYAFGRAAYDEDEFSGFDYRLFGGGGIGYYLAKGEPLNWKIEAGPGYRYSLIDDTRETSSDIALYAASETDWIIREGFLFEQDFNVTWTDPTTTFVSLTALTTALTDSISTGISFEYRYETNPPLGRENTDTVFRANLAYGF